MRRHRLHRMEKVGAFPAKLGVILRAMSLSRVALAQDLQVDKSLIGRWLSGAVHPTEHNLVRLTLIVSRQFEGFGLADWFVETGAFLDRLGLPANALRDPVPEPAIPLLGPFLDRSIEETRRRGAAYEGFWRTARPSMLMAGKIFHAYGMLRLHANGLLEVRMHGSGLGFHGWMMVGEGNLFVFLHDPVGQTPLSLVLRGVTLPYATVLDGLLMLAALDAGRTLGAVPIVLERLGELSGDPIADEIHCGNLADLAPEPLEPLGEAVLRARIFRSSETAPGGSGLLSVGSQDSLSRGATGAGLVG